jgi:ribose transport system permease protein
MRGNPLRAVLSGGTATAAALLVLIFAIVFAINPSFAEPSSMLAFLKKAAPLVILAAGQYFVIASGEFDLSVGSLVGAQVVIAAKLLDGEDSRTVPVLLVMVVFGVLVGLVNGVVTTLLRVPSFITTLGMMLVLFGAIRLWTGGAPTGALTEAFRQPGRGGIQAGEIGLVPWALFVMLAVGAVAVALMRSPYGRTLLAVGDNPVAASFSGVRVALVRTSAFVLSSVLATVAAILIGGYAGVTAQVGTGLEFVAITAVVLGGVALGGGKGFVTAAMGGALVLEALFTLFNQLGLPSTARPAVQGVIIIAAVALAARQLSGSRRPRSREPAAAVPSPAPEPTG